MPMISMGGSTTTWSEGNPKGCSHPQVSNHSDTIVYHACGQHGRPVPFLNENMRLVNLDLCQQNSS